MFESKEKLYENVLAIVATLNEEEGIGPTLTELTQFIPGCVLLVVDGNSIDKTVAIAKGLGAEVIFQKGKGKGDAINCALRKVGDFFDYIVLIDADCTYPAKKLPDMIDFLERNENVGMICGNRFNSHLELNAMHDVFYFGNRIVAFVHNLFNGSAMRDPLTGLRVIRSNIVKEWVPKSRGFDIEVELNSYVERRGYEISELDIKYLPRIGEKKLKIKDGFVIIKRMFLESMY